LQQQYENWPLAILIAIDQLGNALAGGHPDATISARVGYFSANAKRFLQYWKALESVINFAFFPIDGEKHCYNAWQKDRDERFQHGNDLARIFLGIIIFVVCPIIAILLLVFVIFIPSWRKIELDESIGSGSIDFQNAPLHQLRSTNRSLTASLLTATLIGIHGVDK